MKTITELEDKSVQSTRPMHLLLAVPVFADMYAGC